MMDAVIQAGVRFVTTALIAVASHVPTAVTMDEGVMIAAVSIAGIFATRAAIV
jgi:hypothetical protein